MMLLYVATSLQVGLLYAQRDPSFVRPISHGVQRCLVRWWVDWLTKMISNVKESIIPHPLPPKGSEQTVMQSFPWVRSLSVLGEMFVFSWGLKLVTQLRPPNSGACLSVGCGHFVKMLYIFGLERYVKSPCLSWSYQVLLMAKMLDIFWKRTCLLMGKTEPHLITLITQLEEPPYLVNLDPK